MTTLLCLLSLLLSASVFSHVVVSEKRLLDKWEGLDRLDAAKLRLDYAGAKDGRTPALCLFKDLFDEDEWEGLGSCE